MDVLEFATKAEDNTTGPDTSAPEANTETATPADPTKIYPNVLRTYVVGDFPANEAPEDKALTVKEFAGHLTLENFETKGKDLSSIVDAQQIYTALRTQRYPLPVILVQPKDADGNVITDHREATVYLPWEAAKQAWAERPVRGAGTAQGSKRTDENLLLVAAKKRMELEGAQARLDVLSAKVEKFTKQDADYTKERESRNITEETLKAKIAELQAAEESAEENKPSEPDTTA